MPATNLSKELMFQVYSDNLSIKELAEKYNICTWQVQKIKRRDYQVLREKVPVMKSEEEIQRDIEYILKEVDKVQVVEEEKESAVDRIYGKPKVV